MKLINSLESWFFISYLGPILCSLLSVERIYLLSPSRGSKLSVLWHGLRPWPGPNWQMDNLLVILNFIGNLSEQNAGVDWSVRTLGLGLRNLWVGPSLVCTMTGNSLVQWSRGSLWTLATVLSHWNKIICSPNSRVKIPLLKPKRSPPVLDIW